MMKRIFAPLLAALFLGSFFGALTGCNTVAGAGEDVEHGGRAIKNEAREHQ